MNFHVISIGTLASNSLWGERAPMRTGHATTTLIVGNERRILVNPGLPAQALLARLAERTNTSADDITDVFLTHFTPDTSRGIVAFQHAAWWISQTERESVGVALGLQAKRLKESGAESDVLAALERDIAILRKCQASPDHVTDRVDLFPLPGPTPGHCGLLLEHARYTVLICGDAIPTEQHLEQGKVISTASDVDKARESFEEAVEIADLLVLGRDNLVVNPTKRAF